MHKSYTIIQKTQVAYTVHVKIAIFFGKSEASDLLVISGGGRLNASLCTCQHELDPVLLIYG